MQELPQSRGKFIPDFSGQSLTFRFFVGAQLIAIILTIARNTELNAAAWHDFLLLTAYMQTVALLGIAALKLLSEPLKDAGTAVGTGVVFVVLLAIAVLVYEGMIFGLYAAGITPERWPANHTIDLIRLVMLASLLIALTLRYTYIYQRGDESNEDRQQDRLQALQSRIRPHFLFNSMNSVASLIRSDPDLAEKALQDLADVFRVVLADARKMVPITAEGELARQYLDIEKLRLGDRLQVKWTASNVPRSALIPSLTLQPLLENAVYHGIEPSFAGGTVDIQLWSDGETLKVMISNPLPEVTTSQIQNRAGNKIALDNVRERLHRHFGGRATLENLEQQNSYRVKITMPIVRG